MIDEDLAAMSIRPPDESEIIPFTPQVWAAFMGQPATEILLSADPSEPNRFKHTWRPNVAGLYLAPGAKLTPYTAQLFVDLYNDEISRMAIAVAERAAPFAIGDAPKIHVYATEEKLLKWSLGSPYHRGLTEEYFTVAAVTYTASNGRFITIPITFDWETGKIEANFNADKVGR